MRRHGFRRRWRLSVLFFFSDSFFGLLVSFLRVPKSVGRVFHRLLGMFVTRLMILFAMMRRGSTVSVSRKFVKLRGSLMRIVWHTAPLPLWCHQAWTNDVSLRTILRAAAKGLRLARAGRPDENPHA